MRRSSQRRQVAVPGEREHDPVLTRCDLRERTVHHRDVVLGLDRHSAEGDLRLDGWLAGGLGIRARLPVEVVV